MPLRLRQYLRSQASTTFHYFLPSFVVVFLSVSFLVLDSESKSFSQRTSHQGTTHALPQIPRKFQNYQYPRLDGLGPIIGIDIESSHSHVSYQGDAYSNFVKTIANFASVEEMHPGWVYENDILNLSPFNFKALLGLHYGDMEYSTCSLTDYKCWFGFRPSEMQHKFRNKRVLNDRETRYGWSTKEFPAERIASHILERLRYVAERELGVSVQGAIIAIPNYFGEMEIAGIREAADLAGLPIFDLLTEAWASGLAYGLDTIEEREMVLVYNLGESAFEATIFSAEEGVFGNIVTIHNEELGAEQFNKRVVEYMINLITIGGKESIPPGTDLMSSLKVQVERAKILLSTHASVEIEVGSFRTKLSWELFKNINDVLFRRTMNIVDVAIKKADSKLYMRYRDRAEKISINRVIVSGNGANMPRVQKLLENHLGKAPTDYPDINPDHTVVIGAAKRAHLIQHNARHRDEYCTSLLDLAPLPLGVETAGGMVTGVSGGTGTWPFKKMIVFTTEVEGQEEIAFRVLEGLSLQARNNKILGAFKMQVPPAAKGVAHVHISFELASNGKLNITATQKELCNSTTIIIGPAMGRWNGLQINQLIVKAGLGGPEAMDQLYKMHRAHAVYEGDLVIDDTREQMRRIENIWTPMSRSFNCTEGYEDDSGWTALFMKDVMRDIDWDEK